MFRIILILLAVLSVAGIAEAQQRATLMRAEVQTDTRFSADFQSAMEAGNYSAAAALVRQGRATGAGRQQSAAPAGSASLSVAAQPTEPAEYTCNGGNCACAGASDCVAMAPICEDGTIGCNDYGCTCKEAD